MIVGVFYAILIIVIPNFAIVNARFCITLCQILHKRMSNRIRARSGNATFCTQIGQALQASAAFRNKRGRVRTSPPLTSKLAKKAATSHSTILTKSQVPNRRSSSAHSRWRISPLLHGIRRSRALMKALVV